MQKMQNFAGALAISLGRGLQRFEMRLAALQDVIDDRIGE